MGTTDVRQKYIGTTDVAGSWNKAFGPQNYKLTIEASASAAAEAVGTCYKNSIGVSLNNSTWKAVLRNLKPGQTGEIHIQAYFFSALYTLLGCLSNQWLEAVR